MLNFHDCIPDKTKSYCINCGWRWRHSDGITWPHRNCRTKEAKYVGDILHNLIFKFTGQKEKPDCKCSSHINEMNAKGPAWCRENIDTIVGWLMEEADKRGMLKSKIKKWTSKKAAKLLVKVAIWKAK